MTTRQEISDWFDRGVKQKASHMLVICDTFDHDDYPVYVSSEAEAHKKADNPGSMQRVMEVYRLDMDRETQLNQPRARNF